MRSSSNGRTALDDVRKDERDQLGIGESPDRLGLALSGGGIRSATVGLGVLQALAKAGLLNSFDYLSTVSGGGYIGSWLSAWLHRNGMEDVQARIWKSGPEEAPEVTWLRRYSNYLAPKVGLTMDMLTLATTWFRNTLLNVAVLALFLAAGFVAVFLVASLVRLLDGHGPAVAHFAGFVAFAFCMASAGNLEYQALRVDRSRNPLVSTVGVGMTVIIPYILLVGSLAYCLSERAFGGVSFGRLFASGAVALAALMVCWSAVRRFAFSGAQYVAAEGDRKGPSGSLRWLDGPVGAAIYIVAGLGGLLVAAGLLTLVGTWLQGTWVNLADRVVLAPPAVTLCLFLATSTYTGLVGRAYNERSREWWSRLNAWLLYLSGVWLVATGLAFYALPFVSWLIAASPRLAAVIGTSWLGSLVALIFLRPDEHASSGSRLRIERIGMAAAAVVVVGFLVGVAAIANALLYGLFTAGLPIDPGGPLGEQVSPLESLGDYVRSYRGHLDSWIGLGSPIDLTGNPTAANVREFLDAVTLRFGATGPTPVWVQLLAAELLLILAFLLFGRRVDVNKFSLHNLYKNRLVRCYLGASNSRRSPQPFTGLDDGDDIALSVLARNRNDAYGETADGADRKVALRPLHLVNTALNLTQGRHLAWQERKAASFTLSALHCGYVLAASRGDSRHDDGKSNLSGAFRPTFDYASDDHEEPGLTLGSALATSGAAVSPNMGQASHPLLAFALTVLNLRLGRWCPNPASDNYRSPGPRLGLMRLLQELFGFSDEASDYVYLSDGGHFDNLGLYELVRRECRLIVAIDAAADPELHGADLAESIRKCRVDLGVTIARKDEPDHIESRGEQAYPDFLQFSIEYRDGSAGDLWVVKPARAQLAWQTVDVQAYAAAHPDFPHESTADQFFGESQFESYRKLGESLMSRLLGAMRHRLPVVKVVGGYLRPAQDGESAAPVTRLIRWLRSSPWERLRKWVGERVAALKAKLLHDRPEKDPATTGSSDGV